MSKYAGNFEQLILFFLPVIKNYGETECTGYEDDNCESES